MSQVISLTNEKFSLFMDVLSLISKSCEDVIIKDGVVRQSTTTRCAFLELNLSESVGINASFSISRISQKYKMLSAFCKQDRDLVIEIGDDNNLFFISQKSKINTK